jgi:hypothetical protein
MKNMLDNILFQTRPSNFENIRLLTPFSIFDEIVIEFFDELSKKILNLSESRKYPDLASFAFLCRKRNINRLKSHYNGDSCRNYSFGRGISLHFTPSNVPLNFAYSLYSALLSGNICLIRMSSKFFEQADILVKAIKIILDDSRYEKLRERIHLFKYEHNDDITNYLTSLCDLRIIWGSDETINTIRKHLLPAKAYDISFSDRYSFCVIGAKEVAMTNDISKLITGFYNDTLFFDQNACTSPKLIYWYGTPEDIKKSQAIFWNSFDEFCQKREYINKGNMVVEKLVKQYMCAVEIGAATIHCQNAFFNRSSIDSIPENFERFSSNGGLFLEYQSEDLSQLNMHISRKLQTLTYFGLSGTELFDNLPDAATLGIDRIVPVGRSSDFSLIWDGYDLIRQMSKTINIL